MKGRLDTLLKKVKETGSTDRTYLYGITVCLLQNFQITETRQFHKVSAVSLRCGEICNDHFVANFVLGVAVKKI